MKLFHLLEQELSTPPEHIKKKLYAELSLKKQSRTKKKKSRLLFMRSSCLCRAPAKMVFPAARV